MEDKYNPERLLLRVANSLESEGKMAWSVAYEDLARYEILIEIKDSNDNFRIRMLEDKVVLLRRRTVKNHDELEKNKDNLGGVVINRMQKSPINYSNYEDFSNHFL